MKGARTGKRIALLLLAAATAGMMAASADLPPADNAADGAGEVPAAGRTAVAENERFLLAYDESGADIYVTDKADGTVWSNAVDPAYYASEDANRNMLTMLLMVNVTDEEGGLNSLQLFDAERSSRNFSLQPDYRDGKLRLRVELIHYDIAFAVDFALEADGFTVTVPEKGIEQRGASQLVSLSLLPSFGAARTDQAGYLFYPDGCGALIEFDGRDEQTPRLYSYPIYGEYQQDLDRLASQEEQDIKNIMLPVYGIRASDRGYLAAVTAGAAEGEISLSPGGFQAAGLARGYFSFNYMQYTTTEINETTQVQLIPYQYAGDKTVRYFLLDGADCDYSAMAAAYRGYLEQAGVLRDRLQDEPTLSIDFFMGIRKQGFLFEEFVKMTTFQQAGDIVERLAARGVQGLEVGLLGWGAGGYAVLPGAVRPEGQFGGAAGLRSLQDRLASSGAALYLAANFVDGDRQTGQFDSRNNVVRNYLGQIVTDEDERLVLLDVVRTIEQSVGGALDSGLFGKGIGLGLQRVGQRAIPTLQKKAHVSRREVIGAYEAAMERAGGAAGRLQVYGGNQYVLPYAGSLREIPDRHSAYFINTRDVPFYQMVVSGYAAYTSIAGNQAYDFAQQKLRWIEYGSTPFFILTAENPLELADSSYHTLFSSQAGQWEDAIVALYEEYTGRLAPVAGQALVRHEVLDSGLVRVTYENGARLYINYTQDALDADGAAVAAMDYRVVAGGEG